MKKHRIILIVIFTVIFILSAVLIVPFFDHPGTEGKNIVSSPDTLLGKIDSIGKNPFNSQEYTLVKTTIMAQGANGQISKDMENSMLQSLDLNGQLAISISINRWMASDNPPSEIAEIITTAKQIPAPITDLTQALYDFDNYQNAMAFNRQLDAFLAGEWNQGAAQSMLTRFDLAINRQPFSHRSEILNLRSRIIDRIRDFQDFYINIVKPLGDDEEQIKDFFNQFNEEMDKLNKYPFYRSKFTTIMEQD